MDREGLRRLAEALPAGSAVPVPREWLLELLGAERAEAAADLTVPQIAERFGRSASTVRWWIESDRFPGAYRLRGREWRVPPAALAAFEAAERDTATAKPRPVPAGPRRAAVVDLGDWRKVG